MRFLIVLVTTLAFFGEAHAGYTGRLVQGTWQQSWNDTLKSTLDSSALLKHDEAQLDRLCNGYKDDTAKRKKFWQQLFISLAWKESLHGPTNYINFNGGVNKGLYQIDPRLLKAYSCGSIDLFNPIANIRCAVKMAERLTDKFGSFLQGSKGGMAAYWQPLRSTTAGNAKNRTFILTQASDACKSGTIAYNSTTAHLTGIADATREASLEVNTIDDLGLNATDLDNGMDPSEVGAPNFEFDPGSGLLLNLGD